MRKIAVATALSIAASTSLFAGGFDLGKISVSENVAEKSGFETNVYAEDLALQNLEDLGDAVDNVSGVNLYKKGGRSEETVSIRGADARRVGVFVDGVPIYVPYDGNMDYDRFKTADISSIQISKGFSSVIYGANTLGGVINVVTKKPTKPIEGSLSFGTVFDNDFENAKNKTALNLGAREKNVYVQVSSSIDNQNFFSLSKDFQDTENQKGTKRVQSEINDRKFSTKVGYIFDDKSEIALGVAKQEAKKNQPLITDEKYSKAKNWNWPVWDKESIYVIGDKKMDNSYLKASVYVDKYDNQLDNYKDATYSSVKWTSVYDDESKGARVEYGILSEKNTFKVALNYKNDIHKGYDVDTKTDEKSLEEHFEDTTTSIAVEDVYTVDEKIKVVAGVSFDSMKVDKLWDSDSSKEQFKNPGTQSATNPQIAMIYALSPKEEITASIAQKTHLPTMKERYSRSLKKYKEPNVDLEAEIANHYEVNYKLSNETYIFKTALFTTKIKDAIDDVVIGQTDDGDNIEQNQNIGDFTNTGFEVEGTYFGDSYEVGGNYTYLDLSNDNDGKAKIVDVPEHTVNVYGIYDVDNSLKVYGNLRHRAGAYGEDYDYNYVKIPSFSVVDTKVIYEVKRDITTEVGINNLFDKNYSYDLGFPEAGREYFANVTYKF